MAPNRISYIKEIVWTYFLFLFSFQLLLSQTNDFLKVNFLGPENLLEILVVWDEL